MPLIRDAFDYIDRGRVDPMYLPENKVLIGTHHKTGTVWMAKVFVKVARKTGMTYRNGPAWEPPQPFDIYLEDHSRFSQEFLDKTDYRGIHIIRDPRDVIVSGMFYHQKSDEKWLHRKQDKYGGLTYQEKLNSYASIDDKILFEMDNAAGHNIQGIMAWNYDDPDFFELKYEDLIVDSDLELFHQIFLFLGYRGAAIPLCLDIAFRRSLYSSAMRKAKHVRSGKPRQWPKYLNANHRQRFKELFGDALIKLGYETDDTWVDEPQAAAE